MADTSELLFAEGAALGGNGALAVGAGAGAVIIARAGLGAATLALTDGTGGLASLGKSVSHHLTLASNRFTNPVRCLPCSSASLPALLAARCKY